MTTRPTNEVDKENATDDTVEQHQKSTQLLVTNKHKLFKCINKQYKYTRL